MNFPFSSTIKRVFGEFSFIEKAVFVTLSLSLGISALFCSYFIVDTFRKDAPGRGGELHEGAVGYPNFINPLLSISESGKDLSYLLYAGLMKVNGKGEIVPDLAESFSLSDDGRTYTFKIRENAVFHDNKPITADDVVFTIEKVKDPNIKSPFASNWQGVDVRAVDAHTVEFILKNPYAPFVGNATIGILPKHIWNNADIEQFTFSPYNFEPIGSGPYMVKEIKRDASGTLQYYKLRAFKKYAPGEKNITTIILHFFPDNESLEKALQKGTIKSVGGITPEEATRLKISGTEIKTADLLRIFGVFFNQNQAAMFTDKSVRQALSMSVDRNEIIDKVLYGYGTEEHSPLPQSLLPSELKASTTPSSVDAAKALLEKNGWKMNDQGIMEKKTAAETRTLSFSLTTSNNPDLVKTAEILKEQWLKIGADVSINALDPSTLNQTAIRPRKYDALLFGEIVGRGADLYPFWHSSERKDPGLNIALYTNSSADRTLEILRTATSTEQRTESLKSIHNIIAEDVPAIFLYSPEFIYILPSNLKNVELGALELPYERWATILDSYIKSKRVWK